MIILEDDIYRSANALNFSSIKNILLSPKHYKAALAKKIEPSEDMLIGSVVHAKVLEGKDYPVAVMPEGLDGRTKEGKSWKAANADKETMSRDGYATCQRLIQSIQGNADVQYLLGKCTKREIGIVQKYRGIEIKGKIDAAGQDESGNWFIVDLKTAKDANPQVWAREASSRFYFLQLIWYRTLLALELGLDYPPPFYWLVAEKTEASDVCIFSPPPEAVEIGQAQMDKAIDLYTECSTTGKWNGYGNGILELEISPWERKKWLKQ